MSGYKPLPRCTPAQAGLDPRCILAMIDAYEEKGIKINSFMLLRRGQVLCEGYYAPYAKDQLQTVYSLSKTFTSMAIGIAEGEGILGLDERVVDIFADEVKASGVTPGPELSALTLRHLLRMSTGQPQEPWRDDAWDDMRGAFLKEPFTEMPGEVFRYNTIATYMLSAALKKRGVDLEEYLQEKLLTPLGVSGTRWMRDPHGICTGGFGFSLYPEVIARLGLCILADGKWEGQQLIPRDYLAMATRPQIYKPANELGYGDWNAGYGYQMWMCESGAFRGDGMYGQLCIMDRRTDTVLAMTALSRDMGLQMQIYTENILTQYHPGPIAEDAAAMEALCARLGTLRHDRLLPQDDGAPVPQALLRGYDLPVGWMELSLQDGVLTMRHAGREVQASRGAYRSGMYTPYTAPLNMRDMRPSPLLCTYAMQGGALIIRQYDVEFIEELTLTFTPGEGCIDVHLQMTNNPDEPQECFRVNAAV